MQVFHSRAPSGCGASQQSALISLNMQLWTKMHRMEKAKQAKKETHVQTHLCFPEKSFLEVSVKWRDHTAVILPKGLQGSSPEVPPGVTQQRFCPPGGHSQLLLPQPHNSCPKEQG